MACPCPPILHADLPTVFAHLLRDQLGSPWVIPLAVQMIATRVNFDLTRVTNLLESIIARFSDQRLRNGDISDGDQKLAPTRCDSMRSILLMSNIGGARLRRYLPNTV